MQNFFNNNDDDEEKQLIQLTDTVFKTVSKLLRIGSDFSDSVWNTVHKLVKIASEQNKLLLQFPAILAYFVYNFLKNIDLDRIDDINEKLDDIQRLIQRKNLQGLSFNTIKQMLQQELQERKFRRNRPNKGKKQQEGQKQSGNEQREEGENQQGEKSENKESQEQEEQELEKESQESNEQENDEEQEQHGVEEGEQQSKNKGAGEGEGEEQEGENEGNQEEGEEAEQQPSGEGESQEGAEEGEAEESQSGEEGEEAESQSEEGQSEEEGNEGGQGNAQEGQELGEESESEGSQSGEEGGEGQELGEEGEQSENEGQNSEGQEGQNSGEGENEGEQQSGEESVEAQNGEEGQEGGEQGNEEQSGNEGGQEGEESQSEGEGEGEAGQGGENENEESQSGEQEAEGESQEGEQGGGGESEGTEQEGGEGEESESESIQGQNGEQGGEGSEGEGQEIEDIFEDLEDNIDKETMILDQLEESLQKSLSALSIGKGSGGGILNEVNPRILELLERANRILALANQVDLEYANRGVKDQGGVMKGITTGNNIKHMFRSQLILPDEIFLERYTNRALLQRAVENEGVGDFYFIIDKSWSMRSTMPNGYSAFENVSAVALASAMEAEKNNKKVFVQYFDTSSTEPLDVNNVFEIAQTEPGGGTDMMDALRRFMDYYNNYPGLKDVRQIFIMSDFETNYDNQTLQEFKNFAKNNGLIVTCLHVYGDDVPDKMQYIIDEICDEYYKFNNYDASELFSVVYSKV